MIFLLNSVYFVFSFNFRFSNDEKYDDDYIETITADGESVDKNSINQQIVCINSDGEYPTQIEVDEYNEEQLEEDVLDPTQYTTVTNKKGDNSSVYYITAPTSHSSINNDSQIQSPPRQQTKVVTQTNATASTNDPDERFLLSCLPILKRLSNKKNALARMKIQQLLFEIEFDEYDVSSQ